MKKEEFIQFVAKNIKYHLPSEFKDFKIEVGKHMGLVLSLIHISEPTRH